MIFTELRFIALLGAAWASFAVAPRSWRSWILAVWGIVVYGLYADVFLVGALALTLLVYAAAGRRPALAAGLTIVGVLAYFKLQLAGAALPGTNVILIPLGLSYLSFELLHLLIERQRGSLPAISIPDLLAFAFFAPARVAGPIRRYPEFMDAVRSARVTSEALYAGLCRVLMGLAKKYFVADVLRLVVVSELVYVDSPTQAWKILLAYTFQLFFDFSAYTDMAIGFARMLGITLPENFRRPYLAVNIRDFWDRWHITLSHWVRDYVFLPTGRRLFSTTLRRAPVAIAIISYLVTFLVVGAWHGLAYAFLAWGLYHGLLLAAYHLVRVKIPARIAEHPWYHSRIAYAASVAFTFVCVMIGWVPFMADMDRSLMMLRLLFGGSR